MPEHQIQKAASLLIALSFLILVGMIYVLFPRKISDVNESSVDQQASAQRALTSAPKYGAIEPEALFIQFGDFQCPGCKNLATVTDQLYEEYGDTLQFVWIHSIDTRNRPESRTAAIAAQCASEQNQFKAYHTALFENQESLGPNLYSTIASDLDLSISEFNSCLVDQETTAMINDHQRFTEISRVSETPTVAINDKFYSGDLTYESLKQAIDEQLAL